MFGVSFLCGYDIDRMSTIDYIKTELLKNTDADDIMAVLVQSFETTDAFKDALCDEEPKCKTFFASGETLPDDQKQLWRLHHKITKICKTPSEICNFAEVKQFYADRKNAMEKYKVDYPEENVDALITELEQITINGGGKQRGGKQKGGNWLDIVRIIAGIEVALSKVGSTAVDAKNRLYALCQKAGSAIYNAPSAVSECLRALMGETLYKILKNIAKGVVGAGALTEIYQNIGNIMSALITIVKYVPYAAGLLTMLSTGLVVFKLAEKLRNKVPGIMESAKTIVANAVNEIDAIDIDTMQSQVVDAIQKKLKDASESEKELIEQEMNEFKTTIHEILYNAILSPEAIEEQETLMKDIDDRATEMVIQIQKNIFKKRQIDYNRKINEDAAEDDSQGPVENINTNIPPAITNIPPAITNIPPAITTIPPAITNIPPAITNIPPAITTIPPAITNIPPAITNIPPAITTTDGNVAKRQRTSANLLSGGKTHKKHHKKTHKKSAAKQHKKSHKKQRRSRKH